MFIKKKQKALAALLSAVCSVTSANASESKKIGAQRSGNTKNIFQGNNITNSKIKSSVLDQKSGLKGGFSDFVSKHAGLLFVSAATTGGLLYNVKSGWNYHKERSKNEELKKSASDIETLREEVNRSNSRCDEMNEEKLHMTREQMAMEALVLSSSDSRLNPVELNKNSESLSKLNNLNYQDLENKKKEKYIKDDKASNEFKKSLQEISDPLTSIMIKLGTQDDAFKEKLNSSLRNLKPQDGNGVIDLFKAVLKSFEEAWCAASLDNTKSDNEEYNKLNDQKARLEFFINKYLNLLLPMDADTDGLPKNKNTRTVAIILHLFYKNDAENQLTIKKLITNSFGNSIIISKLAEYLQSITSLKLLALYKILSVHPGTLSL